jgi:hypothetical protein
VPYRAIAAVALQAWRAALARREAAEPGSPEWLEAERDEVAAKIAYQEAVEAARRAGTPEPPPFDEALRAEDEPVTTMTPPEVDGQLHGG